jgi:iron complex outermembrane receptor protein
MMRLAVQQSNSDGFRHNATLNRDTNARDEFTARLRLTWNPNALWRWDGAGARADFDNGFDEFALDNNGRPPTATSPGATTQESVRRQPARHVSRLARRAPHHGDSLARTDSRYSYDDDWTARPTWASATSPRRWVQPGTAPRLERAARPRLDRPLDARRIFLRHRRDQRYTNEDPGNIRGLKTPITRPTRALFGQLGHDFSPRTRLIAGLRAERIEMSGDRH